MGKFKRNIIKNKYLQIITIQPDVLKGMTKNEANKKNTPKLMSLPDGERVRLRGKGRFDITSLKDF